MHGGEMMILAIINMLKDEDFESVTIVDKDGNTITYSLPSAHLGGISRQTSEDEFSETGSAESEGGRDWFDELDRDNKTFCNSESPGYQDVTPGPRFCLQGYLAPVPRGKNRKSTATDPLDISWPGLSGSPQTSEPSVPPSSPEFVSLADIPFVPPSPVVTKDVPVRRVCTDCPKVLSEGFVHPRCRDCHNDRVLRSSGKATSVCGDDDCAHLTLAGQELCQGCYRSRRNQGTCTRANCRQTVNYGHKLCRSCHLGDKQNSVHKADVARAKARQAAQAAKGGKGSKVRAFGRSHTASKCK